MGTMFISYRRSDSATVSGRIYDYLARTFGENNVFKDVYAIPPGVNFAQYIDNHIRTCSVLLAVIGSEWANASDQNGLRRVEDPNDFVRLEIELALKRKIPIIPVLVGGATMPSANILPPSLHNLTLQNAVVVRTQTDFDGDMGRLSLALSRWTKPVTPLKPPGDSASGHPVLRNTLTFGILITVCSFAVVILAASIGNSNQSAMTLLSVLFTAFMLLCCFLAGLGASRRSGLVSSGTSAGLLTGILGALLAGLVIGIVTGSSPSLTTSPSDSVILGDIGVFAGLLLLVALITGAALGNLGGRLGNRRYLRALTRR
jgi:hypothetical protein